MKERHPKARKIKHKTRLIIKEYIKKKIEFDKILSLVIKITSIQVLLACVAYYNLELKQLDVTTTFLHGKLGYEIYMS